MDDDGLPPLVRNSNHQDVNEDSEEVSDEDDDDGEIEDDENCDQGQTSRSLILDFQTDNVKSV